MRELAKSCINALLVPVGARAVGRTWGPRGFPAAFERIKCLGLDPATVIDVGASDGRWTRECRSVFPSASYALFDALAEHEASLASLAASTPGVTYWHGALGSAPGRTRFNVHGHQSSVLTSSHFPGRPVEIEMRTLDSFIEPMRLLPPILLKADVQGYELEVLRGAPRCLEMTEVLLLEVSFRQMYEGCPLAHEVVSELGGRGYRIYDICTYTQRACDGELAHADIVFAKANSRLFAYEGWS